jgi:hypothetical protein
VAPAEVALVAVDGGGRGSFNGQFANFGNRRTAQPPLTGSFSINLNNSALNAAPFSLNGQNIAKGSSNRIGYTSTIGGPMVIPKLLNWQRASFNVTYQGTVSRSAYNGVGTLPSPAERTGDFSQLLTGNTTGPRAIRRSSRRPMSLPAASL